MAVFSSPRLVEAIDELARYLKEDPVACAFDVGNSFYAAAELWRQKNPKTPEEIAAYYRESTPTLRQLVFANYGIEHEVELRERAWHVALATGAKSILDLGAGIGSFFCERPPASIARLELMHADFAGVLTEYAKWRYAERRIPVKCVDLWPDYAESGSLHTDARHFDFVNCTEVLEHAPDPEAVVRLLARFVRRGGTLVATVSFHDDEGLMPFHLNLDRWTDEEFVADVFPRHGFEKVGEDTYRRVATERGGAKEL